jgi:GNAT superfamily N-acetyltransferase
MTPHTQHNLKDRPDLQEGVDSLAQYWDEFMLHSPVSDHYFGRLYDTFIEFQSVLTDANDQVIARMLSVPIRWEGDIADLPDTGWDWALANSVETYESGKQPNLVSAIEISIHPDYRGKGISKIAVQGMKDNAVQLGFDKLVVPVRPSLKSRYPLTPATHYAQWTQTDSDAPFDPWLRVHWRVGGRIVGVAGRAMTIPGTVAEWESWTGMRFPESGDYIIPGALTPVEIDLEADKGIYVEPNVWMLHTSD